jgi:hypothetical protein
LVHTSGFFFKSNHAIYRNFSVTITARMDQYVVLRFGWLYGPGTWYGKDGMIYNQFKDGENTMLQSLILLLARHLQHYKYQYQSSSLE